MYKCIYFKLGMAFDSFAFHNVSKCFPIGLNICECEYDCVYFHYFRISNINCALWLNDVVAARCVDLHFDCVRAWRMLFYILRTEREMIMIIIEIDVNTGLQS